MEELVFRGRSGREGIGSLKRHYGCDWKERELPGMTSEAYGYLKRRKFAIGIVDRMVGRMVRDCLGQDERLQMGERCFQERKQMIPAIG